jgi:hypothetical protein
VNVQDLAFQKYANHHQILKLFKARRNVQSLNKIRSDKREGKQLATKYLVSEPGAKRIPVGNIQDCFSTFMDNW